jgi:tetratricopeptide (TPR) repeat protein
MMQSRPRRQPERRRSWLRWTIVVAGLALVPILSIGFFRNRSASPAEQTLTVPQDPWASFTSPFRNARPEVRYVGDAVCAGCHVKEAETFRLHPMGRDLALLGDETPLESYEKAAHNPFKAFGFQLSVDRREKRVFHRVAQLDSEGRVIVEKEQEVKYVIGSGTRTHSYLFNHDGYLLESPITWFSHAQVWDLSPGFVKPYIGGRPIAEECLFCHCNHAEHVPDTVNRYQQPIFTGLTIGCERCHGPGALHAKSRGAGAVGESVDDTIVNPAHLEPVLRESVCQQCHLEGRKRILRRGIKPFDFRPGQPIHRYMSVFVAGSELGEQVQFVGQVEELYASRCFQASQGKMGCISCHDPHVKPSANERVKFFRTRCLNCHREEACSVPIARRRQADNEDSCIQCHMPRRGSVDVTHTAITNHRIVRRPDALESAIPGRAAPGGAPLVYFHQDLVRASDPDVERDLGLALVELAWSTPPPLAHRAIEVALPLLEKSVRQWPDDGTALGYKGKLLWLAGRQPEALADLQSALRRSPRDEGLLESAGAMATALGQNDVALDYWQRAVEANPWNALNQFNLARLLAIRNEWAKALNSSQAAVDLDPFNVEGRILHMRALIRTGDVARARAESKTILALQPTRADELSRWFRDATR